MEFPEWRIGRRVKGKATGEPAKEPAKGKVGYYLSATGRFWVEWDYPVGLTTVFEAGDWGIKVEADDPPNLGKLRF